MADQDPPWVLKPSKNWVSGLRNSDVVGVNPKDALGSAKVPLHLVPVTALVIEAVCMDDGGIKYGPFNVRMEPIQALGYLTAAMRHIQAVIDGMDYDSVTGKMHLGYARATLGLYLDAQFNGTLIDNRPVPGIGGQMIDALSTVPGAPPRSPDDYRKIFEALQALGKEQTNARRKT